MEDQREKYRCSGLLEEIVNWDCESVVGEPNTSIS